MTIENSPPSVAPSSPQRKDVHDNESVGGTGDITAYLLVVWTQARQAHRLDDGGVPALRTTEEARTENGASLTALVGFVVGIICGFVLGVIFMMVKA